jgi:hypothetical protein
MIMTQSSAAGMRIREQKLHSQVYQLVGWVHFLSIGTSMASEIAKSKFEIQLSSNDAQQFEEFLTNFQ